MLHVVIVIFIMEKLISLLCYHYLYFLPPRLKMKMFDFEKSKIIIFWDGGSTNLY